MNLRTRLHTKLGSVPKDSLALACGVLVLGLSTYVFLLIAGRQLGDEGYAPLGAMWMLVFLITPGMFFPVEQEIGRAIAARRAQGLGAGPVVKAAVRFSALLVVMLILVTLAARSVVSERLFDGELLLEWAFILCIVTFSAEYVVRGVFAGNHHLGGYSWVIGAEGLGRVVIALILMLVGTATVGPYGLVVGVAPLASVIAAFVLGRGQRFLDEGPPARIKELTASIGTLIVASLLSQALVNTGPLIVKYSTGIAEQSLSGAFTKAVIITRIPLFLFQAVQAAMLPRLTDLATRGEFQDFRSTFRAILLLVTGLGLAGIAGTAVLGNFALDVFGSEQGMSWTDLAVLAAGNAIFLLCMAVAQALVAVAGQRDTVIGWFLGLLTFLAICFVPGEVVTRVVWALVAGSLVSFVAMLLLLRARVSNAERDPASLVDAPCFGNELIEP